MNPDDTPPERPDLRRLLHELANGDVDLDEYSAAVAGQAKPRTTAEAFANLNVAAVVFVATIATTPGATWLIRQMQRFYRWAGRVGSGRW